MSETGDAYKIWNNGKKEMYIKSGWSKLFKAKENYNIVIGENNNNILTLNIANEVYYYGLVSGKIRKQGSKDWTGKLIKLLKTIFQK